MHHIAVQARDWDASLKLYRDVLGMELVAEFGGPDRKIILLDMGDGSHMELFAPTETSPAPNSESPNDPLMHFALATSDTRAAIEHVRKAGVRGHGRTQRSQLGRAQRNDRFFSRSER